jgi:hypothetical protein
MGRTCFIACLIAPRLAIFKNKFYFSTAEKYQFFRFFQASKRTADYSVAEVSVVNVPSQR